MTLGITPPIVQAGRPVLIAGPTASGKSALALALAERLGGWVVNADSMQVYREWRILTARPSPQDEARAPHMLYGHVGLTAPYSVGAWLREVGALLARAEAVGATPIVVGGAGLYFMALTEGLAEIPPIPPQIRAETEARLARDGLPALAAALARRDPQSAAALDRANPRRVLRAWEVLEATGEGLAAWRARTPAPLIPIGRAAPLLLTPPRDWLYARCDRRFARMMAQGAMDEIEAVLAMNPDPDSLGMKAVGAPELIRAARGEIDIDEAIRMARTATRNYAKRQMSWFRNRMIAWKSISELENYNSMAILAQFLTQGA